MEGLETVLLSSKIITDFQRNFAWLYTLYGLEKNATLRPPVAALGYAYQLANRNRTDHENSCLKRLAGIVRHYPPDQLAAFKAMVEKFTAPPPPLVLPGGMGTVDGDGAGSNGAPGLQPQDMLIAMQQFLKGTGLQAVANFDEAVAHARMAVDMFPDHPDILVQAAVCHKTRAAREKDLPIELRIQDMERAIELMDRFVHLSLQPDKRNRPDFKARRTVVHAQATAMRESLQEVQEKMHGRKKKDDKKKDEKTKDDKKKDDKKKDDKKKDG
jgi:hypothetical protein